MPCFGRLRRSSEIAYVRRRGRRISAATLVAYVTETNAEGPRLAVTVSKALGKAVVRNLVRRRVRSAFEVLRPPARAINVLVVMKPGAASQPYGRLAAEVADVLAKLTGYQ